MTSHRESELRFGFGENWLGFLSTLTDDKIAQAVRSIQSSLSAKSLDGKTFLDVGSGSGLFSLAAHKLGAKVHSFDYDAQSAACTLELKHRYCPADTSWRIETASILDEEYLSNLGKFDVVYSWGVLHHTGHMYRTFANIVPIVATHGKLFIAIYNDQGWISRYWSLIKRTYNRNRINAVLMILVHAPYLLAARYVARALTGRLAIERGMSLWVDMIDWLGGYPFEVAKPEEVIAFFQNHGFLLENLKTCGGRMGCNEFVFRHEHA